MKPPTFRKKLLAWYSTNKRDLPWRETSDPYRIWISEIILQQTRVAQGLPYYDNFIRTFPTVFDLASADEDEVLMIWEGLGYYTRARNMHACAKMIVTKYHGVFPSSYEEILSLPGIGPYTAAAVSSICFSTPKPVIDGNVFRVLSRIFGIYTDIQSSSAKSEFERLSNSLIDHDNPGDFNQAIMEFGAINCTPSNPVCSNCSFQDNCYAFRNDQQKELPVKKPKNKPRKRHFHYFIFHFENKIFLKKRTGKDIWKGLYEFYLVEKDDLKQHIQLLNTLKSFSGSAVSRSMKHVLTHQVILAEFIRIDMEDITVDIPGFSNDEGSFYTVDEALSLPKPVLINKYLKEEFF